MNRFVEVGRTPCAAEGEPSAGATLRLPAARGRRKEKTALAFDLLRWFSIVSLLALVPVAAATGIILSHFLTTQALQRDAFLTAQFVRNCVGVEAAQSGVPRLGAYLDPRVDVTSAGMQQGVVAHARQEVFDHLETLPGVVLTNVYARDRTVVWSTDKSLIGRSFRDNKGLAEAFATHLDVVHRYGDQHAPGEEQLFGSDHVLIESYVPLMDTRDEVVAVVQVYKEPSLLMAAVRRGQLLVWATTMGGGILVYLGLFSIVRRAACLLKEQQRQLVEAESQVFAGEMATALAHSLRNPLGGVRSSAELALSSDDLSVRKNAEDIITQVDFLSQWVRELLLYSRPAAGEAEAVDLCAVLHSVLGSFAPTFRRAGIQVVWQRAAGPQPLVEGNNSLVTQALHSVISNAVEAMPKGGEMKIELRATVDPAGVDVLISDTGVGMSIQQLATAFRPFQTTKSHGLGVGLPMLKRAMERFGGFVTLASAENSGTQVRLHFRT
jgi:two-component system sensor histidine kinase HydH